MNISMEKFRLAECLHGIMIWPKADDVFGKSLPLYGEWSEGENIIMSQFIQEGDIVLDIGANLGTTVLSLSKKVGEAGKVIAFEPQSLISQCLQTSLTLNDVSNVSVYNAAVSDKAGWAYINDEKFSSIGRFGEAGISESGTRVQTIMLDELDLESCALVKIDVEGHELKVIEGGQKFLAKHKPIMYMEAKNNIADTKLYMRWLIDNGWSCYWHFAFWYRENNFNNVAENIWGGTGDMNIVAVPNEVEQPKNLLKLENSDEDWDEQRYLDFYKENSIPMI